MLESLFIANASTGQVIIEKHWRGEVHRSVIEGFFKDFLGSDNPEEISPVFSTPQYLMVHILKGGLVFLGVVSSDVSPIVLVEFLHQVVDTITSYIKDLSEISIKENFVIIYQLLEEMVDFGFPLMTDVSTLKNFVAPPNILNKVMSQVTGVSRTHDGMLSGGFSNVTWRKTGIKYTNNEIYFDIIEEIDAIVESDGSIVSSELNGSILSQSRLSGMPNLLITFDNISILDDYSFNPCVKHAHFSTERALSFIPPDGHFKLMTYRSALPPSQSLPLSLKTVSTTKDKEGRFEFSIIPHFVQGIPLEDVILKINIAKGISNVVGTCNMGVFTSDYQSKQMIWKITKLSPKDKCPSLTGTYSFSGSTKLSAAIDVFFQITMCAASGLKVESLKVLNENYKPYKGVRSVTRAGRFQIRL